MHIPHKNEPDRAIDAATLVPARGRLLGCIAADRDYVVRRRPELHMARQVVEEAYKAVGAMAEVKAVDPNVAIGHDSVEHDIDAAMGIFRGQRKGLAIPGDPGWEKGSSRAAEVVLVNGAGDAPVMRQGDTAPGGIVEGDLCRVGLIALEKLPLRIEIDDSADGSLGGGGKRRQCRERERCKQKRLLESRHVSIAPCASD